MGFCTNFGMLISLTTLFGNRPLQHGSVMYQSWIIRWFPTCFWHCWFTMSILSSLVFLPRSWLVANVSFQFRWFSPDGNDTPVQLVLCTVRGPACSSCCRVWHQLWGLRRKVDPWGPSHNTPPLSKPKPRSCSLNGSPGYRRAWCIARELSQSMDTPGFLSNSARCRHT